MTALLADYTLFLAKAITVAAVLVLIAGAVLGMSRRQPGDQQLTVERLNERYERLALTVKRAALSSDRWKKEAKAARQRRKQHRKTGTPGGRVFVLDFRGDLRASATASLREEVSAILGAAEEGDRVVVRLENAGGTVHEHGLAASQLVRLKTAGLDLTVTVDKVAASGGYLMAAVADRIIAAPFAILGSIGVIAQLPNFHRWLESRGVDYEQITAGRYKRTLTVFGENTDEGRDKLRDDLEVVHHLFKDEVARHRQSLDVEAVATGEIWYGTQALELKLVDEISTSDDYLMKAAREHDLLLVRYRVRRKLPERIARGASALWDRALQAFSRSASRDQLLR